MNIQILDSWLRDYLKTKATPQQIADKLSLTSVSIERIEKIKNDYLYDIEVTTNRPELMSVIGIAAEAATVLPQFGIQATYVKPKFELPRLILKNENGIDIKNDPKLVKQISAVIMDVTIKDSPQFIKDRLVASGIRSLNNAIDATNYVMREIGHPTHVFDYDRLSTKKIIIRESRKGEKITTLDGKEYTLPGGDIVADNGEGEIIDLLGIMGTANSVVTGKTKRILFFIDNVDPHYIRKTSMCLGIRTEAAILNEKGINPLVATNALALGIKLLEKIADAKITSNIIQISPYILKPVTIVLSEEKVNKVIGIKIPSLKIIEILTNLEFKVKKKEDSIEVIIPPSKISDDMTIAEDLIEEIARIYGYHNIPNTLPAITSEDFVNLEKNQFYWEDRVKDALKYWGFTEVYTYPMVSKELYIEPVENAVTIENPLTEDIVYMRRKLTPSLLKVVKENPQFDTINIFEIAFVYEKTNKGLPSQTLHLSSILKKGKITFYHTKGIIEQLARDLGINNIEFKIAETKSIGEKVKMFLSKEFLGELEIHDNSTISFELNFELLLKHLSSNKTYTPISKFPQVYEDLAIIAPINISTGAIIDTIKKQNPLIIEVSLLDKYQDTRTFHIVYQSYKKNLTSEEVGDIRQKILKTLKEKFNARLKE